MKRTGQWARKKPLRARKPLARRRPAWKSRGNPNEWQRLRQAVFVRDWGRCVCCGQTLNPNAFEAHHRKFRSRLGADSLDNLIAVDLVCHRVIHGSPLLAEANGWAVASHADPALIPVLLHTGQRVYLTAAGTYEPAEEAA